LIFIYYHIFELIHLLGNTAAETVKYGANAAHQAEYAPEQRPGKDVGHSWFGMG
jgi:hypothetical protein